MTTIYQIQITSLDSEADANNNITSNQILFII